MYEDKKVAIAGAAVEGLSALQFFQQYTEKIVVLDEDPAKKGTVPDGVEFRGGPDVWDDLSEFDLVSRTAGLPIWKLKNAKEITSTTKIFFDNCPSSIIGITGTKGKGTTATLTHNILVEAGLTSHLVGNIGNPVLSALKDITENDTVVFELSSFQLWDLHQSPHIAVVLMISKDHLDVHPDMSNYLAAKANITAHQTAEDIVICHPSNTYAQQIADASSARKVEYAKPPAGRVEGDRIMIEDEVIVNLGDVKLVGQHNLENICAALTAAWQLTQDAQAANRAIRSFTGLSHRLELVAEIDDVEYYDDSISTTPESAVAAIKAFDNPKLPILGGSSKGSDFYELAEAIKQNEIRAVILLGDEAAHIGQALHEVGFDESLIYNGVKNMTDVVELARELTQPGDVVILSPACASFDMFDNYKDRGQQFDQAVRQLAGE